MSEYIIKAAEWAIDYKGESLFKDGEEITRCRDCRFYTDEPGLSEVKPDYKYCSKYSNWDSEWDYDEYHYVEPDGFCKWGERRVEE